MRDLVYLLSGALYQGKLCVNWQRTEIKNVKTHINQQLKLAIALVRAGEDQQKSLY